MKFLQTQTSNFWHKMFLSHQIFPLSKTAKAELLETSLLCIFPLIKGQNMSKAVCPSFG
jgi:hypothetical protein